MAIDENAVGTRRRAAVRVATVAGLVTGCLALALAPLGMRSDQSAEGAAARGPTRDAAPATLQAKLSSRAGANRGGPGPVMAWQPVSATGGYTIVGNEIQLGGGGQEVTLELQLSGWGLAPGGPQLGAYQGQVLSAGYASGAGDPLTAKGWPGSPADGAFIDEGDPDYVFLGLGHVAAVNTVNPDYLWAGAAFPVAQTDGGGIYYGGTLILEVPPGAAGTYTIAINPDPNYTLMADQPGNPIPNMVLISGTITVGPAGPGACCIGPGECVDVADQVECESIGVIWMGSGTNCATEPCECLSDADCDDGNACTMDVCEPGTAVCQHIPTYDIAVYCCNPMTGQLTPIEDLNDCTNDICDEGTGAVTHWPVPDGTPCDDGDECTVDDSCEAGACAGAECVLVACTVDAECAGCPGERCDQAKSLCTCGGPPTGPTIEWQPVSATGGYSIVGNAIQLSSGGQEVTLELQLSGWGLAPGAPQLGAYQGQVLSAGYASGAGDPLTAKGWPGSPADGAFIDEADPDYVFLGLAHAAAVNTVNPDYLWASAASPVAQTDGGGIYYGGTLILEVPPGAVGTYTIALNPDINYTLMTDQIGSLLPGLVLISATITVDPPEPGACCISPGECVDVADQVECESIGVIWMGTGTDCVPEPCECTFDTHCNDDDACTTDSCNLDDATCSHIPEYDDLIWCCDPVTGQLTALDDGNDCTEGYCEPDGRVLQFDLSIGTYCGNPSDTQCDNPDTCDGAGACLPNLDPDGTACDDGNECTAYDACEAGDCAGVDCGTIMCITDADCAECLGETCLETGVCGCSDEPTGPTIEWQPVSATGSYSIIGNSIQLSGGGQEVTLELQLSGWGLAPGGPQLGAYQGQVLSAGYAGGAGDPLTAKGWPGSPADGAFIDEADSDYVFLGLDHVAAANVATPDYLWAGAASPVGQTDGGGIYYGGTLILEVPPGALGTYTIALNPDINYTLMTDQIGSLLPGLVLISGTITVNPPEPGACCVGSFDCLDGTAEADCVSMSGIWMGSGTDCMTEVCDCTSGADCDDNDACTTDSCDADATCVHIPEYDDLIWCCDPVTGQLTPIDDGDACTDDVCDPGNGIVDHIPAVDGSPCDDGDECTTDDVCTDGMCFGKDCTTLACEDNADCLGCPGEVCGPGGFCFCGGALEPTIEWKPVSATGVYTIIGNDINLVGGGQEVTLEIRLSGWGNAPGSPELGAVQGTVDSTGYSSGTGAPLSATGGWIDTLRGDFVFQGLSYVQAVNTSAADYAWAAAVNNGPPWGMADGGGIYYLGTLTLDVPPGAAGTYTIDYDSSNNWTLLNDQNGSLIPGLVRIPGTITVKPPPLPPPDYHASPPGISWVVFGPDFGGTTIPADFFAPGSDPFEGQVNLEGAPIDPDSLGGTSTILQRSGDPVFPEDPPLTEGTVDIELIALNLVSTTALIVTYNGGQDPEEWDVHVGLSPTPAPLGYLDAVKEHPNGGVYFINIHVQPILTFTRVSDGLTRVLDTPDAGKGPYELQGTGHFVHTVSGDLDVYYDPSAQWVGGIREIDPGPQVTEEIQVSNGTWLFHGIRPPPPPSTPPPPPDPHATLEGGLTQIDLGQGLEIEPIPADFFGPGSDPFDGVIDMQGDPPDPENSNTSTVIQRASAITFPGPPPSSMSPIEVEIVALSLKSVEPITVTYNGGQDPEQWDVGVGLSDLPQAQGGLGASLTHANGGTYTANLPVTPKFIFVKVGDPGEVQVLDYGLAGYGPLGLDLVDAPFVIDLAPHLGDLIAPSNGNFVPGVREVVPGDPGSQVVVSGSAVSVQGGVVHGVEPPVPPPPVVPPGVPPDPTHQARKHRYLSIDASTNGPTTVGLRVELTDLWRCSNDLERSCTSAADCVGGAPCVQHPDVGGVWWVQAPQEEPLGCLPGPCGPTDQFARLDAGPYFARWSLTTLHVGDCEVIPVATYELRACLPPDGAVCSGPLVRGTIVQPFIAPGYRGNHSDVAGPVDPGSGNYTPPDGFGNVTDVQAYILTKQNYGTANLPQTHPTWVDLHGNGPGNPPQYIISVADLQQIIKGIADEHWTDDPGNMNPGECP